MNAMLEPSMVAARTQGPDDLLQGFAALPDLMTPSSHGCLPMLAIPILIHSNPRSTTFNFGAASSFATLPERYHVAGSDDSRPARISFYTQSAVRLKAARDALERFICERDAHAPPAREGRARLPLAYDFGRTARRVQRLVSASERARQRLKQALRVGRARHLLLYRSCRLKNLRRESPVVEIDADADDDRAPLLALYRLREYAAQLTTRSEQIVRPLDV